MPKKQKGVNPLIATILLLLVCMAIGGIIWSWLQGYTQTQRTATEEQQKKQAGCAGASFTIDLTDVKPTYYSDLNAVRLVILNKSDRNLNQFKVYAYYSDGSSDLNSLTSVNIEEGGSAVVWTKGGSDSGQSKPERVTIESMDCEGIKAEVSKVDIETG